MENAILKLSILHPKVDMRWDHLVQATPDEIKEWISDARVQLKWIAAEPIVPEQIRKEIMFIINFPDKQGYYADDYAFEEKRSVGLTKDQKQNRSGLRKNAQQMKEFRELIIQNF